MRLIKSCDQEFWKLVEKRIDDWNWHDRNREFYWFGFVCREKKLL